MAGETMRFKTDEDAALFLVLEVKNFQAAKTATKDYVPTKEEMDSFIKRRTSLVDKLKDHRKGQDQKSNWRKNRYKMMKGIKAFHRSTKGKKMHKKLGNFLANRIMRNEDNKAFALLQRKALHLEGVNTARQHMLVELKYYHEFEEQVEIEEVIVDYSIPMLTKIENAIVHDLPLSDDQLTFLFDITETGAILQYISLIARKKFAVVENLWNDISKDLIAKGIAENSEDYYVEMVNALKPKLIKEKKKK